MGNVAAQAHQNGSMISATSPSRMKAIQNIFFCMEGIVRVITALACTPVLHQSGDYTQEPNLGQVYSCPNWRPFMVGGVW